MKILLIGRNGQLAWELRRSLACLGDVVAIDRNSDPITLDLIDTDSIKNAVLAIKPGLIVNASAYTAVDRAEQDSHRAHKVNANALAVLSELAIEIKAGLIHYSTDYVFKGDADQPYSEEIEPEPVNIYGQSKRAGESVIALVGPEHLIFRTAWVYGMRGSNFLITMLNLMRKNKSISVVSDQIGAPTWTRQIAEATAVAIAKCTVGGQFRPGARSGIYHMTCNGQTSWFGFAQKISELAISNGLLPDSYREIRPVRTAEYPTAAARPNYSLLSHEKIEKEFDVCLPDWESALEMCLSDMASLDIVESKAVSQ